MSKSPKKQKQRGKLPSGNIRIQVYDYTDEDGKRHYKSFTAPTRAQARLLADQWRVMKATQSKPDDESLTIYDAVGKYIDSKSGVLSPGTYREYLGEQERYFSGSFGQLLIYQVDKQSIQLWVSELAQKNLSPKTIRNIYGLFSGTIHMFRPDYRLQATLPQKRKPHLYCPNDNDIKALLEYIKGTELELAVLLAAFGPLRRAEICALTDKDISGNTICVRHNMVLNNDKVWVIKEPKTTDSDRYVAMPPFVIEKFKGRKGLLVNMNPDMVTGRFIRTLRKINVPRFRFHDLRHYSASIMHAIGVPDQYIMARGGWSDDRVLKTVYRNVINLEEERLTQVINGHFEGMQHEIQHEA